MDVHVQTRDSTEADPEPLKQQQPVSLLRDPETVSRLEWERAPAASDHLRQEGSMKSPSVKVMVAAEEELAVETVMLIKQAKDKGLNLGAAIEAAQRFREREHQL